MNERIKELALEAKLRPALLLYYYRTIHGLTDTEQEELEQIEKFAELIVKECAEQSMSIGRYNTPSNITPDLSIAIAVGLKKHFGVEE